MEPKWVEFDALVEVMPWGRNVYTIIRCDPSLENAARTLLARRVEGTIDEVQVNVGVNRALADAGRLDAFERQTPAQRRRLLQHIEDAVKPETRQQRITALGRSLSPG